ncbi:aminotransferase class I/II-fold pyridoxal phosphate-dependent enzyme [Rhodococcoides fascians]|jgi:valine--pyruvate aminotransferase|uniref:aminotransferase class I/II-fold pyridoxal phosphate-dependent enzyme n=1 Tax=Rhodococcoides fascians TaxID=1828 RepID=UPI003CEACE4A
MRLSDRGEKMSQLSGIREILQDIALATAGDDRNEWVDLGAGSPARIPEVLSAVTGFARTAVELDLDSSSTAYGPSRGSSVLLDAIIEYFSSRFGWSLDRSNIVVGPGSQMLLFAATTVFTGPGPDGHKVLVLPCLPDYTGYQGLELDVNGVVGVAPEVCLLSNNMFRYALDTDAVNARTDVGALLLSDPRNPTGDSLTATEFDELLRIAETKKVPLLVDHAYGEPFPKVAGSRALPRWHPNVVHFFTFSKFGIPGERLGFAIGPSPLIEPLCAFVSNTVLHGPQLFQAATARALRDGSVDDVVRDRITPHYEQKRRDAEALLHDAFDDEFDWRLHVSEGGMFCWLWIREPWFQVGEFYQLLKTYKVCVVPGNNFFVLGDSSDVANDHAHQCVRISLSRDVDTIARGIGLMVVALRTIRDRSTDAGSE